MPEQNGPNEMPQLVEAALTVTERLQGLLDQERQCLAAGQVDGLNQLLTDKLEALQALERNESARRSLLERKGYRHDRQGMEAFLAAQGDTDLSDRWERLLDQLQRLRTLNEANGQIIQRGMRNTQHGLAALTGQQTGTQNSTYGRDGGERSTHPGREISRA